jgi:hypothetical protein
MSRARDPRAAALLQRWDRIGIGIRCAYNPQRPSVIRLWLGVGRGLGVGRVLDERTLQQRMLEVLLQTAHDEALPWGWRCACVENATLPAARLTSLFKRDGDATACLAVDAALRHAHDVIAAAQPGSRIA